MNLPLRRLLSVLSELGEAQERAEVGSPMINSQHQMSACFHSAVAVSQAFIAVVAGVAVAFALWS